MKYFRTANLELDRGSKDGQVTATISSETPVPRYFGQEILEHTAEAIDLSRVRAGLPLLWGHDGSIPPVGRASNIRLENRKLKADLRPARNAKAQELWQDVLDGNLDAVSIGYEIDERSVKKDGEFARVTKWRLVEVSLVSVGADPAAGIGRADQSLTPNQINLRKENIAMERCAICNSILDNGRCALCGEKARVREIRAMGKELGFLAEAEAAIEAGTGVEDFRKLVIRKWAERKPEYTTPKVEVSESRIYQGKPGRITSYREFFGIQPEAHGFRSLGDFCAAITRKTDPRLQSRALSEGVGSAGGYAVPTQFSEVIFNDVVEQSILLGKVQSFPMSTDVLKIPAPELTSHATGPYGITAAWTAEGGNAVEQSPRLREIELKAMKLFFYAACTGELLSDAPNFDGVLRRMFSEAAAWHIDKALISGNGAGEPLGVLNAPCKLLVNRGTASQFRYVDAVGMLAKFAPNLGQPGIWLVHPTVVPYLHQLVVDTNIAHYALQTNQNGNLVLLGKEVFVTEKCRPLGTSGDVVLVNPAAIYFGSRSQWTIEATNAELFRRDMVSYRLIARLDSQISWNQALTLADGVNQVSPVVVLN